MQQLLSMIVIKSKIGQITAALRGNPLFSLLDYRDLICAAH